MKSRLLILALCALCLTQVLAVDPQVTAVFKTYCLKCHGPDKQKGDFRVDEMRISQTPADAEYWQLILDNLHLGEMPPKKSAQPTGAEREHTIAWIEAELKRAARMLKGHTGEVVLRRLNRSEYEYTIEDLFGVHGEYAEGFPDDAKEEGFDNNGAALMLSAEQVNQYLAAADFVINRAIQTRPRPETKSVELTLADYNRKLDERERKRREYEKKNPPTETERKRREREAAKGNRGRHYYPKWGADHLIPMKYLKPQTRDFFRVRSAGWYRFKVTGYAARNEGQPMRLIVEYGSLSKQEVASVAGVVQFVDAQPKSAEYRVYLQPNHQVQVRMLDGANWMWGSKIAGDKSPAVAIRGIEMEGPMIEQWPPKGHRVLLGERDANAIRDDDMPAILAELAPRLFRRPVATSITDEFHAFYRSVRQQKVTPLDAFKLTAKAMMASPHFLYHVEVGAKPDAYALANRLSYFLWRSAPDRELLELAAAAQLFSRSTLRQQVDRLLADAKSERFLKDFVGQWLKIDLVGDMQPDQNLYPEYDPELERAMIAETRGFIRELLNSDLSVRNLIDSDWAMLNDRLARHYGIPGVSGNHFRKVALNKSETVRGGLLTHASILNITSNGTTTSPVVRGTWVLEQLLGTPAPPPPPDVPVIEPDIRGASTIKEQLAKHRTIPQCAACHRKIDPYGMALENFDVIGGWREKYRALQPGANPRRPKLVDGNAIQCDDALPQLGAFKDFRAFRSLLLQREDLVQKNMAHKLATFALGRSMDFADEEALKQIVANTTRRQAGLKTMIRELVTSDLFQKP